MSAAATSSSSNPTTPASAPILLAEGLAKRFGEEVVLRDVGFMVKEGEVILLRGNNSSGKTTLLNLIAGGLVSDAGRIEYRTAASVRGGGRHTPEQLARAGIGRMWQDVRLFSSQSLQNNIAVAAQQQMGETLTGAMLQPRRRREDGEAADERARAALQRLGLGYIGTRLAGLVSLGESKRVAIARAVEAGARLLLLDEPCSGLDAAGITAVTALLREVARERNVAMIIVEHGYHADLIREFATTVWTLSDGRLQVEVAMGMAKQAETVPFAFGAGEVSRTTELGRGATLTIWGTPESSAAPVVLNVSGLVVRKGVTTISHTGGRGFNLCLRQGQVGIISAPNGWGKTSVAEALAFGSSVTSGHVEIEGHDVSGEETWERRRRGLIYVPAHASLFPSLTVAETERLLGAVSGASSEERNKRVGTLSGGTRQRLALRFGLGQPGLRLLVLDEPFASLDPVNATKLGEDLSRASQLTRLIFVPV